MVLSWERGELSVPGPEVLSRWERGRGISTCIAIYQTLWIMEGFKDIKKRHTYPVLHNVQMGSWTLGWTPD